jgi:cell division septum initiation protein DivIVA
VDILYLVDRLENLIASSRRMPLVNQIMVREAEILAILDQMRAAVPEEVKQARRLLQEKERILAQAQAEAASILAKAREESERVMDREGLLRQAEERSEELVRLAEEQAQQLKSEANAYVAETLRSLHEHLTAIETEISRTILSIEKGLESLEASSPYVEEESEDQAAEELPLPEEDYALYADEEEAEDALPPHSSPRRSSLAADTMGGPMLGRPGEPPRRPEPRA